MSAEEYYEQTAAAQFMHNLPRFGHGAKFSKLASSDRDEQTDYVVGILAVSFFLLSLFVFWGFAILTCKCMGKKRVGLFAGRARVTSDEKGKYRAPVHLWTLRCTFMALGVCVILLGATLVGPGLISVNSTSSSIRKLNRDAKDLITQGLLIMDSVKRVKWNIDALDVDVVLAVEKACPNWQDNAFASDEVMRSSIRGIERDFDHLREYLEESDFEGIRRHVDHVMDGTERIDAAVSFVDRNDWMLRMFALALNVLVLFMVFASCAAMSRRCFYLPALRWFAELLVLPLFVILIVASWLVTSVLAFASISNADFCAGNSQRSGPAGTVMDVLRERGIANGDMLFTTFMYYESGCATDDPIKDLYKYEDDLQGGIASANDFLTQADAIGLDEINERCGANARPIIEGVGIIKDNLGILLGALRSTFELASCAKMSPVYRQVFEGTACTQSSGSLTLMFSIMFAINVVGMVMITLRSAMYPHKKINAFSPMDEDEEDEYAEYQAYLGYMASFVTMWGGAADEDDSKTDTNKTSDSTESIVITHSNTHGSIPSDDEESPRSPPTPARDEPTTGVDSDEFYSAQSDEFGDDEELLPLSPAAVFSTGSIVKSSDRSGMHTPQTKQWTDFGSVGKESVSAGYAVDTFGDAEPSPCSPRRRRQQQQHGGEDTHHVSPVKKYQFSSSSLAQQPSNDYESGSYRYDEERDDDDDERCGDDERNPLSPNTPSIASSSGGRRSRRGLNFLASALPRTPLMISPKNNEQQRDGANYFDTIVSPLRSSPREDRSVKRE